MMQAWSASPEATPRIPGPSWLEKFHSLLTATEKATLLIPKLFKMTLKPMFSWKQIEGQFHLSFFLNVKTKRVLCYQVNSWAGNNVQEDSSFRNHLAITFPTCYKMLIVLRSLDENALKVRTAGSWEKVICVPLWPVTQQSRDNLGFVMLLFRCHNRESVTLHQRPPVTPPLFFGLEETDMWEIIKIKWPVGVGDREAV
jgi:hypothetical protein